MEIRVRSCAASPSSSKAVLNWTCSEATVTRPLMHLVVYQKDRLLEAIRYHYHIDECTKLVLRLRISAVPVEDIDREWERRVLSFVTQLLELERLMWNLSTLGGAFSAMADYDLAFAERAAVISHRQLKIANRLGDPSIVARCHLYIALSRAQKGGFESAYETVRVIYYWAVMHGNELLQRCCRGINMKIKAIEKFGLKPLN